MDNRRVLAALTVIGMLLCSLPLSISDGESEAANANGLLIYELNPEGAAEGFTLKNYGTSNINLNGWKVSDHPTMSNEGYIEFTSSRTLVPGATVTVVLKAETSDNFIKDRAYIVADKSGTDGVKKVNSFTLANSGDDVYLFNPSGTVIDAICYGNITISDASMWNGASVKISSDRPVFRYTAIDTNSSSDWKTMAEGWTDNFFDPTTRYNATVTPFLFPDHGGVPIYRALEAAGESVYINMYLMKAENLYALLVELENRGVEVYLIVDAGNLGWPGEEDDLGCMKELDEAGGEIRLLNGNDGDKRYAFDHAKYCIIDGETTIVTSENWTGANLNGSVISNPYTSSKGNRGWGAVIESTEYATFMKTVFDNDYSMEYGDVCTYDEYMLGKHYNAKTLSYNSPSYTGTFPSYECQVAPMMSPDSSYDAEIYYIENATTRVYTQQQSTNADYAKYSNGELILDGPMLALKEIADEGLDVRYIVNSDTDEMSDGRSLSLLINSSTNIKAASMTTPNVHNKGLICDDVVIVNSVNWTANSFNNNREMGVIIYSKTIADYYAASFVSDFDRNYEYSGPRATFTELPSNPTEGDAIAFSVEVSPEDRTYTYTWNFGDGSDVRTTSIPRVSTTAIGGTHTVTVTITDSNNPDYTCTISTEYTVTSDLPFDLTMITENIQYIIPILVIILGIIVKVLRR